MGNRIVELKNVKKTYSYYKNSEGLEGTIKKLFSRERLYKDAIKNVDLTIDEGELVGLIGPNGAGKTTLLKMLTGILYPSAGSIDVFGFEPVKRKQEFLKKISIVMGQRSQLWWDLPARDTFELYKKMYNVPDNVYKERLLFFMNQLDVEEQVDVQVRKLSLGQRMKMEIIASLIYGPQLLLLDEPTIGLDIKSQETIRLFIKFYNKEYGNTIILTSHYMKDVQEVCDRIVILDDGLIKYDGQQKQLLERYIEEKNIVFNFNSIIEADQLSKYGTLMEYDENMAKLRVRKKDVKYIIGEVLNMFDVVDVNIEEAGLEEVMRILL